MKSDAKSQAEERLIKKIAKIALNGYEIGIQRRIKPADHIQSMANKIQDTIVTKHPLNAESLSSGDSSREGTLRRTPAKQVDRFKAADSIHSIGNKIKEAVLSNYPMATNTMNDNIPVPPPIPNSPIPTLKSYNTTVPPPLPNTPVPYLTDNGTPSVPIPDTPMPTFEAHSTYIPPVSKAPTTKFKAQSTPLLQAAGNGMIKHPDIPKDSSEFPQVAEVSNILNKTSAYNSNSIVCEKDMIRKDDHSKDYNVENGFKNTLRKKNIFEKPSHNTETNGNILEIEEIKVNNNYSNTMNKRNIFENRDSKNGVKKNSFDEINKYVPDKSNKSSSNHDTEIVTQIIKQERRDTHPVLPNNLHDNSLYQLKPVKVNGTTGTTNGFYGEYNNDKQINMTNGLVYNFEAKDDISEPELVVKRREKKTDRNNDGRRDSHIIARPLSTMTSVDVTDGLYPVCHKCDKPITR